MGGMRSFTPLARSATKASPRRIAETAMEKIPETAAPQVSQKAARCSTVGNQFSMTE